MKTDAFIESLVSDIAGPLPNLRLRLAGAAVVGAALSLVLLLLFYGIRPDLWALLSTWRVAVKFIVALTLAATGAALALHLMRPEARSAEAWLTLSPVPLILAAAALSELFMLPAASWSKQAIGAHPIACLIAIPLLSSLPLGGILWVLRDGAPTIPGHAGAAAGAMAAGIGSAVYAMHCPDDSPLFLAIWYVIAAMLVVAAGWVSGSRMLRW